MINHKNSPRKLKKSSTHITHGVGEKEKFVLWMKFNTLVTCTIVGCYKRMEK